MKDLYIKLKKESSKYKNIVIETKQNVGGKDVIIINALVPLPEFKNNHILREARGIVFDAETKEILSRPFHKFYNSFELGGVEGDVEYILEKVDGSMIHPILENDKVYFKTKMSFYSEQAIWLNKNAEKYFPWMIEYSKIYLKQNITPIFELYVPNLSQIVIDYGEQPKAWLIGLRKNNTGEYINISGMKHTPKIYESYEDIPEKTDIEGVVVKTTKDLYKIKTKWYLERHKYFNMTTKEIIEKIINEEIDDIIHVKRSMKMKTDKEEKLMKITYDYINKEIEKHIKIFDTIKHIPKNNKKDRALLINQYKTHNINYGILINAETESDIKINIIRNIKNKRNTYIKKIINTINPKEA